MFFEAVLLVCYSHDWIINYNVTADEVGNSLAQVKYTTGRREAETYTDGIDLSIKIGSDNFRFHPTGSGKLS